MGPTEKVEHGRILRSKVLATVFREKYDDITVAEGEKKSKSVTVTLDETCIPTLPEKYPLMQVHSWVEVSMIKGEDKDETYSDLQKNYVVSKSLIVLPPSCAKPAPPTLDNPPDAPERLLQHITVEPPKFVTELPFTYPTSNGEAYIYV